MIAGGLRLGPTRRVPQVVRQLAAERALNDRLLEATEGGLELVRRQRPLANKLIKNVRGHRRQGGVGLRWFGFPGHQLSSCYAPHTKFLTGSVRWNRPGSTLHSTLHTAPGTLHARTLHA